MTLRHRVTVPYVSEIFLYLWGSTVRRITPNRLATDTAPCGILFQVIVTLPSLWRGRPVAVNPAAAQTAILSPRLLWCCLDAPQRTKRVCLCPSASRDCGQISTKLERTEPIRSSYQYLLPDEGLATISSVEYCALVVNVKTHDTQLETRRRARVKD